MRRTGRKKQDMAEEIILSVKPREIVGKQVRALRRAGWIPLSVYGAHTTAKNLQAEERPLRTVLHKAGHNRLIRLDNGDGKPHLVIAREIQREPISGNLWHVDFQEISLTEKMQVEVPIVLHGTSPIVKSGNGLLLRGLEKIAVRVLAADLIPEIQLDISGLQNIGDSIHVSNLELGDKVEILTSLDELLAKIIPVKEEVVETEAPVATAEVEVVSKGKKEEDEAEAKK
ncbi:50S ribosomal protein L25 [Anaerolineae bacterium CFX7]|nr:50S ribosomal protein L25 [Anaerolineae bacterium CFX7]